MRLLYIDRINKKVYGVNHIIDDGFEMKHDKLVLSIGTISVRPNLLGVESKRILTLKDILE